MTTKQTRPFTVKALGILIPIALATSCDPVYAHEFPAQQVEYTCATARFYVTTPSDRCIMEQYHWFVEASQSEHYESNLIYGQRHNHRGEVVGIDFKLVLDRVRWLSR